jgi:hypothetical protein
MARKECTEFQTFQDYFKKYQEKFGLSGYSVYFEYKPVDDVFACVNANTISRTATVTLNSKLPTKDRPHKDIHRTAKHEALHLLLDHFKDLAYSRFVGRDSINETEEELVIKLSKLIPDIEKVN